MTLTASPTKSFHALDCVSGRPCDSSLACWAVQLARKLFFLLTLALTTSINADSSPLIFNVTLLERGVFGDSYRDLGPCGQMVGSRPVLPAFGGRPTNRPLVRRGEGVSVLATPGSSAEGVVINATNWVAGYFIDEGTPRPFLLPEGGELMTLPTLGHPRAIPTDLDESSTWISGHAPASASAGALDVPVVWRLFDADGEVGAEILALPLPGGEWGQAHGVNRFGDLVGTAQGADEKTHAILWRRLADNEYDLVDLGEGLGLGLSESGIAVGSIRNPAGANQAFAYADGKSFLLPPPADCPSCESFAFRVNSSGEVVGHIRFPDGSNRASLWAVYDLENSPIVLAEALSPEYEGGLQLNSALQINDAGVILASGQANGSDVQVLLRPQIEAELDADGNGTYDTCEVERLEAKIGLERLRLGQSTQIQVFATTHSGYELDVTSAAPLTAYSVDVEGVVAVTELGTVTGLAPGRAVIHVQYGELLASITVTVSHFLQPCALWWHGRTESSLALTFDANCTHNSDELARVFWDLGDGTVAEGTTIEHEYLTPGQYVVTLTVEDTVGHTATTTEQVVLRAPIAIVPFLRGETNGDGRVDISDSVTTLRALFFAGSELPCMDAADVNDDGHVDISDVVAVLLFLFRGDPIPAPGIFECGNDLTPDGLQCREAPSCAGLKPKDPVTGYTPADYKYEDMDQGIPTRPRPTDDKLMYETVEMGKVWSLPEDGNDPRDVPGPIPFGEELSAKKKRPLILVPGIMATALKDPRDNSQVWPPFTAGGTRRSISDLADVQVVPRLRGEGGLIGGFYSELIGFLERELKYKMGETLFVFPYDWTLSNKISGRKLAAFIRIVRNSRRPQWKDVDVIAHSMGGIVTRTAVIFNKAPVNRTVYLASPHYGAPKAYFFLHPRITSPLSNSPFKSWVVSTIWDMFVKGADEKTLNDALKSTAQRLRSVWELLPDRFYFHNANQRLARIHGRLIGGPGLTYFWTSYPTSFREPLWRRASEAIEFKDDLGPNLPGKLNVILYNDSVETLERIDYGRRVDNLASIASSLGSVVQIYHHGRFGSPYDAGQRGDETVPTKSAIGPGPAIKVSGTHTALPNQRPTFNVIATFLVKS